MSLGCSSRWVPPSITGSSRSEPHADTAEGVLALEHSDLPWIYSTSCKHLLSAWPLPMPFTPPSGLIALSKVWL